jgi:cytochrome c biogenesis protein CcmG, thiol:disulfide interchange protein DsbE
VRVSGLLAFWLIAGSSQLIPAGRPAPPLEGMTLEGKPWAETLTGDITVVEFFATWCPQCRRSLPGHQALAASRQVRLIIVDVDEDPALVSAFFRRNPPPAGAGVLVDQSGRARQSWGVTGFPSVYVVDRAGIIRKSFAGWGDDSHVRLAKQIDSLQDAERRGAAKQATAARNGRAKLPPPRDRGVSADEHARQLGVEVIR